MIRKAHWMALTLAMGLMLMVSGQAFAAAGDLDPTFSGDGKQTTDFGTNIGDDWLRDAAPAPGGKTVAAGTSWRDAKEAGCYDNSVSVIARYDSNGALDTTFSGDGKLIADLDAGCEDASAVKIQADGKPVLLGTTRYYRGDESPFLMRYTATGALDSTFSGDGKLKLTFSSLSEYEESADVALQADGKIVVVGEAPQGFGVARVNANGTYDTTFSGDGKLQTSFDGWIRPNAVAIQADGKIVVVGMDMNHGDWVVARYSASGNLDTSFSGDGKLTFTYSRKPLI